MATPESTIAEGRITPLARFTTLGVGGPAELWRVRTLDDLARATEEPYRVIGAGSNLLVGDAGVDERVIRLEGEFQTMKAASAALEAGATDLWVGAGTPLPGLVRRAQKAGRSGLEGTLGIPAMVGGAVAMNAGTRFGEIGDAVREVEVWLDGGLHVLDRDELALGYRTSTLPSGAVITRVRLALAPSTPEAVAAAMAEVDAARAGQPKATSAGCAFKNPVGDSAGRLIDRAGLKGLRVGDAMVAHEHGNFIVNLGDATAADVLELLATIQARVDVPLEIEWERWNA